MIRDIKDNASHIDDKRNTINQSQNIEKARDNYLKNISETKTTIREYIFKITSLKQIINQYQMKDNDNDYNNSIQVIKKLFNEINNELNNTPN